MIVSKVTRIGDLFDCEKLIIKTSDYPLKDGDIVIFKEKNFREDQEKIVYDYDNTINPLFDPYFTVSFQNKKDLKDFLKRNYKTDNNEDITRLYEFFSADVLTPEKVVLTKINSTFAYLLDYSGKNFYNFLIEDKFNFDHKKIKEIFNKKNAKEFTKLVTSFYKSMCEEIYLRCFYLLGLKDCDIKSYLYDTYDNIFTEKKKLKDPTADTMFIKQLSWHLSSYDKTQTFIEDIFLFLKKNPYLFIYDPQKEDRTEFLCEKIISSFYPPSQFQTVKNELKIYSLVYKKVFRSNNFYVTIKDEDPEQERKIIELLKEKKEVLKEVYRMVFLPVKEEPHRGSSFENRLYIHKRYQVETFIKDFLKKNSSKIKIITGGPGTGKTTRIAAIEKEFSSLGENTKSILFLSYTGKAVCKIKEKVTQKDKCRTIHSALEKLTTKSLPLTYDCIIVDETSMVSGELFYKMFIQKPVKFSFNKLFLIGDPDQLPPIDWGNVFELAIQTLSELENIERLTVNYRQNEYLKKVVQTFKETGTLNAVDDQFILNYSSKDKLKQILSVLKDRKNILFISPVNHMCDFINNEVFGKGFSKGEKVILNENKYIFFEGENKGGDNEILIPNGAIGEIVKNNQVQMIDDYGNKHLFPLDKKIFSLCYCLTVHKMQGSECEDLVLILPAGCIGFIDKKLFYTAISRPKNKLIILTDIIDIKKKMVF